MQLIWFFSLQNERKRREQYRQARLYLSEQMQNKRAKW